jgi:hypothetical protein
MENEKLFINFATKRKLTIIFIPFKVKHSLDEKAIKQTQIN